MMCALVSATVGFLCGIAGTCIAIAIAKRSKVHSIERLYPTLSLARDVYNQVAFKLDKECTQFKKLKLDIKQCKKLGAFAVVCKYESLGDQIFTF